MAGTMSDYAAIVERDTFEYKLIHGGTKPYWSTNSADGRYRFVSWSGDDKIRDLLQAPGGGGPDPGGRPPPAHADRERHRAWLAARQ